MRALRENAALAADMRSRLRHGPSALIARLPVARNFSRTIAPALAGNRQHR